MRTLYLKYGIRLLLLAAIGVYFLFFYEDFGKKQTALLALFLIYMVVKSGVRFWDEKNKLKCDEIEDKN